MPLDCQALIERVVEIPFFYFRIEPFRAAIIPYLPWGFALSKITEKFFDSEL
jgi:hypothetical protein